MLSDDFSLMVLTIENECYRVSVRSVCKVDGVTGEDLPLRGLGILGSGWQMQTCAVESPLLALVCIGDTSWLSISLSSSSTTLTLRFLV